MVDVATAVRMSLNAFVSKVFKVGTFEAHFFTNIRGLRSIKRMKKYTKIKLNMKQLELL